MSLIHLLFNFIKQLLGGIAYSVGILIGGLVATFLQLCPLFSQMICQDAPIVLE